MSLTFGGIQRPQRNAPSSGVMRGNLPGAPREKRNASLMMTVWYYNLSTMEYNKPAGIYIQGRVVHVAYPREEVCVCQEWHGKVRLAVSPARGGHSKYRMFRVFRVNEVASDPANSSTTASDTRSRIGRGGPNFSESGSINTSSIVG
jgi:hypothetical protein